MVVEENEERGRGRGPKSKQWKAHAPKRDVDGYELERVEREAAKARAAEINAEIEVIVSTSPGKETKRIVLRKDDGEQFIDPAGRYGQCTRHWTFWERVLRI